MKKRKIIVLFFVIAFSSGKSINVTFSYENDNDFYDKIKNVGVNLRVYPDLKIKKTQEKLLIGQTQALPLQGETQTQNLYIQKNKKSLTKSTKKKELKREIKRRKRYHKSLLQQYNNDFSNEYLDLITKNSKLIRNLKDQFDNKAYLI